MEAVRDAGDAGGAGESFRKAGPEHALGTDSTPSRPLPTAHWLLWGLGKVGQTHCQCAEGAAGQRGRHLCLGSSCPQNALPSPQGFPEGGGGVSLLDPGGLEQAGNRLRANVLEQEEGHRDPPRASQWARVGQTREKLGLHPRKQPRLRGACGPAGRGSQAEAEGLGGSKGMG